MIDLFVTATLKRRWLVLVVFLLLGVFGYLSWQELAVEAYPDIADTTAQVVTQYLGHAAEEVEEQVTIPIERIATRWRAHHATSGSCGNCSAGSSSPRSSRSWASRK